MTHRNPEASVGIFAAIVATIAIASAAPAFADDYVGDDYCGDGVFARSASCPFATNVRDKYFSVPGDSVEIAVYSPVTNKTYTMGCVRTGDKVTCRGGNEAVVRFSFG
jgi:hypothetical protein